MNQQFKSIVLTVIIFSSIFAIFGGKLNKSSSRGQKKAMATKIAYVNINEIFTVDKKKLLNASDEWRDLFNELQASLVPVEKELKDLEEKFSKGRSEFESLQKSGVASNEALQNKYKEVAEVELTLRKRMSEREQFAQSEAAKAQAKVGPKVEKAIKELRKSQGWDMILRGEVVLDSDDNYNLTKDVLIKINKDYSEEKSKESSAK